VVSDFEDTQVYNETGVRRSRAGDSQIGLLGVGSVVTRGVGHGLIVGL